MRHRTSLVATLCGGLLAITAACGVPTQSSAEAIDPDAVPPPLLGTSSVPAPSTTTTAASTRTSPQAPTVPPLPTETVGLYFVDSPRGLVRVQHEMLTTDIAAPLPPAAVLDELELGPSPGDSPGLRSALQPGQVVSVNVARGLATVDLRPSFRDLDSIDQELAIAQIVLTLTERGAGELAFTIAGQPIQVPTAEAAQTPGPVTREDYSRQLNQPDAPLPEATTTTAATTTAPPAPPPEPTDTIDAPPEG